MISQSHQPSEILVDTPQAVEALNFQITTYISAITSAILVLVLIGLILLPVVGIGWLVLTIVAGIAASRGEDYRYPINLRQAPTPRTAHQRRGPRSDMRPQVRSCRRNRVDPVPTY